MAYPLECQKRATAAPSDSLPWTVSRAVPVSPVKTTSGYSFSADGIHWYEWSVAPVTERQLANLRFHVGIRSNPKHRETL